MTSTHDFTHDGDSEPRYKRQRTAMACFSCRRRKTKCNGSRPACDLCISMGFDCAYPRPPRLSNISNNDPEYVRRVEDRLGTLEALLETVLMQSTTKLNGARKKSLSHHLNCHLETVANSTSMSQAVFPNDAPSSGKDGTDDRSMGADLVDDKIDGMGSVAFADEFASGHFGATSMPALSIKITHALKETLSKQNETGPVAERDETNLISRPPSPYAMVSERLTSPQTFDQLNVFGLPPRSRVILLVDRFFAGTGLIFPYISKKAVMEGLVNLVPPHFKGIRRSWLCLLNTIMAFATVLTPSHEQRGDIVVEADMFLQRALKLLPNVALQPANIEILQALLLLTQYLQGTQRSTQTYNFQGLTVRVAFQIGLHCATSYSKDSVVEREIKNRCWAMTFILDKTCSMTFGRPPCIRNEYLQTKPLLEVDLDALDSDESLSAAEPELTSTVCCFSQSVTLYVIVGEIIEDIYQMNITREVDIDYHTLLEKVISLESKLETWRSCLPPLLKIKTKDEIIQSPIDTSDHARLSTVLTLRYLSTRTLLHRAILTRFLDQESGTTTSAIQSIFLQTSEKISLDLSVSSAVEMIEIHHAMSKSSQKMLTTWWFSLYYVFSSALVIFAAMIVQHRGVIQIESFQSRDMKIVIQHALDAIQYLGSDSRMSSRCRKYLKKLMNRVLSLDAQSATSQQILINGVDAGFDAFSIPFPDFPDISPMGLDMGPFMAGSVWEDLGL